MLDISKEAIQQLKEFKGRRAPESWVRIGIVSGSSSGPSLGVLVDDKLDTDTVYNFDDLEVIIDTALIQYCQKITVEYVQQDSAACGSGGFQIISEQSI
ncbi:MAG: hypothetical protein QNJ17_04380 [Desulfocapsaceae bacterium]|nr:hypothetical protein [Desulfocapsaceae bacterium]